MTKPLNDDELSALYNNAELGYTTGARFFNNLVNAGYIEASSNRRYILDFVKNLKTNEVHTERKQKYKKIVANYKNEHWQCDLIDISNISKQNKGNHFIMTLMDIYSRKAYADFVYRKEPKYCLEVLKNVIKDWDGKPYQLQSDDGKEFESVFRQYLLDNGIKQRKVKGDGKYSQGCIERFNRTIIGYIKRYMTRNSTKKIFDALQGFIKQYNKTEHSTLKATPNDVFNEKETPDNIFTNIKKEKEELKIDFNEGDIVRVRNETNIFTKGREEKYSVVLYQIIKRIKNSNRYNLVDNKGNEINNISYNQLLKTNNKQLIPADVKASKPNANASKSASNVKVSKPKASKPKASKPNANASASRKRINRLKRQLGND